MLTVIAENKFNVESLDKVKTLLKELIEQTKKEEGCIKYDVVQSTSNPGHLTMIEVWESLELLKKHGDNPNFLSLAKKLSPFSDTPTDMTIYKELI